MPSCTSSSPLEAKEAAVLPVLTASSAPYAEMTRNNVGVSGPGFTHPENCYFAGCSEVIW